MEKRTNPFKNLNKKQKLSFFTLSIILIISVMSISGTLPLASLFGGSPANVYGGTFAVSEIGQYGNIVTNFAETTVTQIDFSVTNNANTPHSITPDSNTKKQVITITSTEEKTGYQVKIPVTFDSDMEIDFSDLRFQLADGTDLDQYRESYVDSTSAVWWIKTDLVAGDNIIYMTYGGDLPLKSDSESTMIYYNDCTTLDGLTTFGSPTIINGCIYINSNDEYVKFPSFNDETMVNIYTKRKYTSTASDYSFLRFWEDAYSISQTSNHIATIAFGHTNYGGLGYYDGSFHNIYATSANTWYEEQYLIDCTNHLIDVSLNGNLEASDIGFRFDSNSINNIAFVAGGVANPTYMDYIYVTKAMTNEPTISFGTESTISYDFTKKQVVTLDNSGGFALTDYHMPVTVTFDTDMQSDFSDIRFEVSGTLIPSYPISVTDSTSAVFDIEVNVPADSTLDIDMYYGNSDISNPKPSNEIIFALLLDDSKYIAFDSQSNPYGFTTEFAYEADVYMTSITDDVKILDLGYQSGDTNIACNGLNFGITNGVVSYRLVQNNANGGWGGSTRGGWTTTAQLNTGWNHVKVTRSATEANVYLDSNLEDTQSFIGTTLSSWGRDGSGTRKWHIGTLTANADDNSYTYSTTGTIVRNVKIYSSVSTTPDNLVAQWNVNEGVGSDIYDTVGSIDGTIIGATWTHISDYSEPTPSVSFSSELSFVNPAIEVACTGDSNSQSYGAETKEFSITPSGAISNFNINTDAIDFDFDATVHYTGATSVSSQNATEGTMTFTFTPDVAINNGYANAIFSEDITFKNPEITATLDDVAVDTVFENNNTVSISLSSIDASEHTVVATITDAETPIIPPSSGGGGGGTVAPSTEEVEEETIDVITTQSSEQLAEFELFDMDTNILMIYSILGIVVVGMGYLISTRRK